MQRREFTDKIYGEEFAERDRLHQQLAGVKLFAATDTEGNGGPHKIDDSEDQNED